MPFPQIRLMGLGNNKITCLLALLKQGVMNNIITSDIPIDIIEKLVRQMLKGMFSFVLDLWFEVTVANLRNLVKCRIRF